MNEFDKNGVRAVDAQIPLKSDRPRLGVRIGIQLATDPDFKKIRLEKLTKRGTVLDIHDFQFDTYGNIFYFMVSMPMHESWIKTWGNTVPDSHVVMTFTDFCWMASDGTTKDSVREVTTPVVPDIDGVPVFLGDLTQVIPSKFADDLLDSLAAMNWGVLEGIMENAVIYGPFVK
jgi:hypothetical protein